jgi:catechol 2,3-dioxygenase-like lactoylglutathione lyase family enzyme
MKRGALLVRDMEKSLAFWRDALGLAVWAEGRVGPDHPSFHRLLGVPAGHARYVILHSPPLALGMVGLFELLEPGAAGGVRRENDGALNAGEVALVFECGDVERIHAAVQAAGLTVICPPTRFELPEAGVETLEMTFRDPNGVAVNCIQSRGVKALVP